MATVRLLGVGWLMHVKNLARTRWYMFFATFQPLLFASIAFYMFQGSKRPEGLMYAALGAGLMGIWQSTLLGAGNAIQRQRYQGTLEAMVVAPAPFLLVMLPLTVATASIGLWSVGLTLVWGWAAFGMAPELAHPLPFVVALVTTIASIGMLGLVLASSFVLYRHSSVLANPLDYPVWLACGLLVPLSRLPGWVGPISWVLAPRWGIEALRGAALGGKVAAPLAACAALGAAYLLVGALLLRHFVRLARERASLALA